MTGGAGAQSRLRCSGGSAWRCWADASGGKLVSCNSGLLGYPAAQPAFAVSLPRSPRGELMLERLRLKTLWSTLDTLAPPVRVTRGRQSQLTSRRALNPGVYLWGPCRVNPEHRTCPCSAEYKHTPAAPALCHSAPASWRRNCVALYPALSNV